jgi:hypothetical protein
MIWCLAGATCRRYEPRTQTAAVASETRPLCDMCLTAAARDIGLLPYDWRDLEQLIPRSLGQWGDGQPGHGSEAPIPLDVHVEALQSQIWWLTTTWAEVLADAQRLDDPGPRHRTGGAVQAAVATLVPRVEALARIGPVELADYPYPDDSTTRYRTLELTYLTGAQGVLDLGYVHQRARGVLGLTRDTRRLPGHCQNPECGRGDLQQENGSETVSCGWCGATQTREEYEAYGNLFLRKENAA